MSNSSTDKDEPNFANDTDTPETPSTETSPGILPQKPIAGEAPSREQAGRGKGKPSGR
ncbi:hypothetical protein GGE65_000182 [Skermanella aerolata]|uniref:Uncharacterized protein n=1 Tax=Skermanella aerolata TaxID=393310 RepID=A0A512DHE1_9PROT|nr:hypothetical protein [Skermanella aerolata]KJB94084.1 hypothetical protein N826_20215 [Skermanella aerolata KACC 11604]GEO35897.1 hypothetical protein SAE02_00450 [Skermanella aerolata]